MADPQSIVSDPFTVALIRIRACQLCRRSDFSASDYDDLRQGMRLYLIEKADSFDPARGTVEAFVTNMVNTWVAMQLRYRGRHKRREACRVISLEGTDVPCGSDGTSLGSVLLEEDGRRLNQTSPISSAEHFELRESMQHAMEGLTPEDRALLFRVAEHGVTSTAESLGVSRRQVNKALDRVRSHFRKAELDRV